MAHPAFIVSAARTAIGRLGGTLSTVPAPQLAAACIQAALQQARIADHQVDEVIMGNVISAGIGQNPARQAALAAGLPPEVGATTVNKVCGSGLKAVMLASQSIRAGDADTVVAGGMESMSLAPYLLPQARAGFRMGHRQVIDAMIHDGLWDCYGATHMGCYGDRCADQYGFSRQDQDDYAVRSFQRTAEAIRDGVFRDEIASVNVQCDEATITICEDEEPGRFDESRLRALEPAFGAAGTVTAGNASSISDGAAALVVVSDQRRRQHGLATIARIIADATFSREPEWFTLAPIGAIDKLLSKTGWSVAQTDLFEINEAFSVVPLVAARELGIPSEKLNIYGGAVALGHPIGCTGARILVALLNGLKRTGGHRGIACLCIGGGEAVAMAVEREETAA